MIRETTCRQNRFLVLLIISLPIAAIWLPANWLSPGVFIILAMLLLLPLAVWRGSPSTVHLALLFLMSYLVPRLFPTFPSLLVTKSSGIGAYLCIAILIGPLRRSLDWVRVGRINARSAGLAIAVIAISALGLIGWVQFAHPHMQDYARKLPNVSPPVLALYMATFAIINSLVEEIIWRGVMLTALDTAFGAGVFALMVQAVSFGLAHYRGGFPSGWLGSSLAGLFGLAMGHLRRRTKGLLIPWSVHAAADLTVISLIVYFAHRAQIISEVLAPAAESARQSASA